MHDSERVWREHGLRSAILAGDERAWQTLYEESFEGLYAYVAWRCGGLRDLADDMVQETWLRAVRRIRSFDPDRGHFASWLRGIAAKVIRNQMRKRRPGERGVSAPRDPPIQENRDLAEKIAQALAALPEHYEKVLRAKYVDHWTVADIAALWNETPKAIESMLTRARQAFRDAYLSEPEA